jgi:hypothetical protein
VTSSPVAVRRGSQTPRVSNYPAYDLSAAPEFIDIAEYAGLVLDDWQKFVLTRGLGQDLRGQWAARKASTFVPRQNGKGGIIEALELGWLFVTKEDLIVHTAHQHRTAMQAYKRMERILGNCPALHKLVRQYYIGNGKQKIELRNGRELQYETRSGVAGRGFSTPKLVIDEAQELDAEQIAAIIPTLSAMPNYQAWFFGTPPDDPAAWAYNLKEDGELGVPRMAHFDWGADLDMDDPADRARVHDLDLAYACNPAAGIRITEETILDEMKPSGLGEKYAQERLGHWQPRASGGAGVISDDLWRELADANSDRPQLLAFAIDVNPARTHAAIMACGPREDGRLVVWVVDYRPGTSWVAQRIAELKDRYNPVAIGLDVKGPGGSLLLELERFGITAPEDPERPRRGDLAVPTAGEVAAGFGMFVDAARQKLIRHVDDGPLNLALAGAKVRSLSGGSAWDRRGTTDICTLVGGTTAFWAWMTRHQVAQTYDLLQSFW